MDHNDGGKTRRVPGAVLAPRDDGLDVEIDNLTRLVIQRIESGARGNGGDLTAREIKLLRGMIRREENAKWAWGIARLWGFWIASTVAFFILIADYLRIAFNKLMQ